MISYFFNLHLLQIMGIILIHTFCDDLKSRFDNNGTKMVQHSCKYLINIIIIKKCDDALTGQNFFIKIN